MSFNEVISKLLDREIAGAPANIYEYKRVRVAGKRYPAIIKVSNKNSFVKGVVHKDITSEEMDLLNTFEDDFYQLIKVNVELENREILEALTYIIQKENLHFTSAQEWNREDFKTNHLDDYIEMVKEFRKSYLDGNRNSQEF